MHTRDIYDIQAPVLHINCPHTPNASQNAILLIFMHMHLVRSNGRSSKQSATDSYSTGKYATNHTSHAYCSLVLHVL